MRDGEDGCTTEKVEVMSKFFGGKDKKQIRKQPKEEEKDGDGSEGKIELEWEEEEEEGEEGGGPTHSRSRSLTPTSTPIRIQQRRRSPSPAISSLIASSPPPPSPPLPRMASQSFPSPQSFSPCPSPSLSPVISPSFSSCSRQRFMSQTQYITSPPAAECSSPPVLDFPISSFAEEDKRKQGMNVGQGTEMETETETDMFAPGSSLGMVVSPTSSPTPPLPLSLSRSLAPTPGQSMDEDKSEESEKEEEDRKEKAKMVGGSWRAKWAFGGGLEMKGTPKFGAGVGARASAKRPQEQTPKTVPVQKRTSTLTRSSTLTLAKRREAMSTGASSRVLKNRPVNVVRGEREALRSGMVTPTRAPSIASVSTSSTTERNGMEMKMKVAVKQFGFGRAGRKASEVSGDKDEANMDSRVGEEDEEGEKEEEGEGEDIGSFTPSPERKPLFSRFSVGGSAPPPRSLPCRNAPNDMTTTFSHPFVSCSDLGSNCDDNLNITLKDTLQREQKQEQKQAKQQTRPGLCFVRGRGGSDDVDENTYQQMNQPVRNKTPVSRTTLGRLERYRFEKVSVRK